jgi:hypothetical protein
MPGLASRRPQSFRPNAKRKLRPGGYAAMDHPVGRTYRRSTPTFAWAARRDGLRDAKPGLKQGLRVRRSREASTAAPVYRATGVRTSDNPLRRKEAREHGSLRICGCDGDDTR